MRGVLEVFSISSEVWGIFGPKENTSTTPARKRSSTAANPTLVNLCIANFLAEILACFHSTTIVLFISTPIISWRTAFSNLMYFWCIYGLASIIFEPRQARASTCPRKRVEPQPRHPVRRGASVTHEPRRVVHRAVVCAAGCAGGRGRI